MEKLKHKYSDVLKKFSAQKQEIHRLWNVGENTARLLYFMIELKNPVNVLELGTSNGFSTFHLALSQKAKIYTIDVEDARQSLARQNLSEFSNITFVSERIEDYLPKIDYKIDMLFIDANKTNYLKYLQFLEQHLTDNALVVADNIDSHADTIKPYAEYIIKSDKYITIHLSLDDGLLLSIYKKEEQ